MGPVTLAFWRWAGATLVLLPFAAGHLRRDLRTLVAGWPILLLLSVLGISSFNTILYHAAHTTTATNIALIQATMPAVIVALDRVFFGQHVSLAQGTGVSLAMAGAAFVILRGDPWSALSLEMVPGDLWMGAAMVIYALYSVLLRKRPQVHPLSFLAATFLVGTGSLLVPWLLETAVVGPPQWSVRLLAAVAYVAVFPSILAYLFWNRGVDVTGPAATGLFICLLPFFTALLAVPVLGEALRAYHVAGFALIVTGMALFQRASMLR